MTLTGDHDSNDVVLLRSYVCDGAGDDGKKSGGMETKK